MTLYNVNIPTYLGTNICFVPLQYTDNQCWGKLLLKVMRYNIALLPKKSN